MNQNDLNRAVSRITGETVTTVKRLGFVLDDADHRQDCEVETIDWDVLEHLRFTALAASPADEAAVA